MLRLLAIIFVCLNFRPAFAANADFYWAVAIRPSGWGDAMGTGKTVEAANLDAISRCSKVSAGTGSYLVAKCKIVATFSGTEKGCVSIINGGERHGAGSSRNFYEIVRGRDYQAKYEVKEYCRQGKFGSRGYTYDCRGFKAYCSSDGFNRFHYNKE